MRRFLVVLTLLCAMGLPLPFGFAQRPVARKADAAVNNHGGADGITEAQLKAYLYFIADDAMQGRDTPSFGLDTTANFIAMNLGRWGFKPAGDNGTFLQRIALRRVRTDGDKSRGDFNGRALKYGDDFLANLSSGTAAGRMIYVGDGWVIKSKDIDPYKNIDVKGKIIVYNGNQTPKGVSFQSLRGGKDGEDYFSPSKYAQTHGATGLIAVPTPQVLTNWNTTRQTSTSGRGNITVERLATNNDASLPVITASSGLLNDLFVGESHDAKDIMARRVSNDPADAFDLNPSKTITFTVATNVDQVRTQNVVGVFEGSDPVLKNEYVAVGAHYDHVGVGPQGLGRMGTKPGGDPNDIIYNGADDDGSGTVSILSMAEAISHSPVRPKRSILFVWHCGEEKGLWGSDYFTSFPTIPLDHVIAQLNIDMIGRSKAAGDTNPANANLSGPNEIFVIGSKMMSTELGNLSEEVNKNYLKVSFNYKYDDTTDPNRFFFRSDHYNYARKGVPIIFYFDGVHEDYHRPSDSPDKIDYRKMEKVARTVYATMWELANRPKRPVVDKQLPAGLTNGR